MPYDIWHYIWCACGCDQPAKTFPSREAMRRWYGSYGANRESRTFLPGHAQALRGRLFAAARTGDQHAIARLRQLGWKLPKREPKRQYGVEAEFFGLDEQQAAGALARSGLSAEADGYHHETRPYWRVTSDSSVSNEGSELVSPIMQVGSGPQRAELILAMNVLSDNGARVDASCGLHVHHDAQDMTPLEIGETVAHWAFFQNTIDRVIHPTRVREGDQWGARFPRNPGWWRNEISRHGDFSALWREANGYQRYMAINVSALRAHGTLEFRRHAGTLDPVVALGWVDLTRLFMDVPKRHTLEDAQGFFGNDGPTPSIRDMCLYLGASDTLATYLTHRAETFQKPHDEWTSEDLALCSREDGEDYEDEYETCYDCDNILEDCSCNDG